MRLNRKKLAFLILSPILILAYTNCSGFRSNTFEGSSQNSSTSFNMHPSIPSNFDVNEWIWGTKGAPGDNNCGPGAEGSGKPDVVGAFRFLCVPSHNLYDDPIVYPGRSGASHLHTFFGNTEANANSTYESLRTTGDGTCSGGPINRSAYWIPAMMNGGGKVVMPDYVTIYYKRRPKTDPVCHLQGKECVALPRGLRMIFGYNMKLTYDDPKQSHAKWACDDGTEANGQKEHATIGEAACPATARVGAGFSTPDCWNGVDLDSPDHRSHLAYGGYGDWGYYKCPDTHPYVIPQFTLKAWYTHEGPSDLANWHLSSDRMAGMDPLPNGSSFHSDWFGAWDDDIMQEWTDNAIDKFMNCSDGVMGSGRALKRPTNFAWNVSPRLIDPPAMSSQQKATAAAAMVEMHKEMSPEPSAHHKHH
jgi:Domain of unknown function (DUF1996)